jgi:MoaA/NifB/PqqE/SkfB family radical SAM enzyme
MKYHLADVRSVELEISSHCNAACPQCPRNHHGGATVSDLPLTNWTLSDLQRALAPEFVKQLEFVYFCGTYGDPMFNKNIVDMCQWLRTTNPGIRLGIHTNGGLARPATYRALADMVDFIAFGIDGLEDTNHVYRRNVDWHRVMTNAKAFIGSGGRAQWDFIVFEHNQHQVDAARRMSQDLGFRSFNVKKTYRFFNRKHEIVPALTVLDADRQPVYVIKPPTNTQFVNQHMQQLIQIDRNQYLDSAKISCVFLQRREIYIGSDGFVFPCGWLHDRMYGIESQGSRDRERMHSMMRDIGGADRANCFHTPLQDIVNGAWFDAIQQSWHSAQRFDRCVWQCGGANYIQEQNEHIQYKH